MFRFDHIEFFYAFAVIPLLILLYIWNRQWRKKALKQFGEVEVVKRIIPMASSGKPLLRFIFFLVAMFFLIIGLINPQIGSRLEEVKREGSDIIICLDVSKSMMAQDFKPDRLTRARLAIERLIDKLFNDRLGLIVFAGEAYVQLPITTDYAAAKLFLESVDTDMVPIQGTNIASAIELAAKSFGGSPDGSVPSGKNKTIIIITDGESHDDNAVEAARTAFEAGIMVNTIGVGSPSGAPIPVYRGNLNTGFKKDKEGNTVVTKLNEEALQSIASAGGGVYVRAAKAELGLLTLMERINQLEKKTFDAKVFTDYEDRFQVFIGIALLFLILESLVTDRKSLWWEKMFYGKK